MRTEFTDVLANLQKVSSRPAFAAVLEDASQSLGFEKFTYFSANAESVTRSSLTETISDIIYLTNLSDEWIEHYVRENYSSVDRVIRDAFRARLANRINEYWTNANLPLRINRFGSILKLDFDTSSNGTHDAPRHSFEDAADVFFVHLLDCGVTVHASQVMYLSTAHTDSEIDSIVDALISASEQTAADGFF